MIWVVGAGICPNGERATQFICNCQIATRDNVQDIDQVRLRTKQPGTSELCVRMGLSCKLLAE